VPEGRLPARLDARRVRALKRALALAVLLSAAPAPAGDLIRFRAPDGTIGMVDSPAKLPPGAQVLGVSTPTKRAPDDDTSAGSQEHARDALLDPGSEPRSGARRMHAPASSGDSGASASSAGWCSRGRSATDRVARAEERLASAEEAYDRCDDGGRLRECSRGSLDAAERELANAEENLSRVEADCRSSGCDPGWLRCAP
jgi:hypothetical protein